MKKRDLMLAACFSALGLWSCSDNNTHGSETTSDTTVTTSAGDAATGDHASTYANTIPLAGEDSTFVHEAAIGGMMEVEAGNLAQQNANSQRVKDLAAMIVRDHSQANNELKSLVANRGVMLPDSLPADKRKHIESMRKMTGKAFDNHYISMMRDDHKKDIIKFEKAVSGGKDAEVKNWAAKTLPTLRMHRDSVEAVAKARQ